MSVESQVMRLSCTQCGQQTSKSSLNKRVCIMQPYGAGGPFSDPYYSKSVSCRVSGALALENNSILGSTSIGSFDLIVLDLASQAKRTRLVAFVRPRRVAASVNRTVSNMTILEPTTSIDPLDTSNHLRRFLSQPQTTLQICSSAIPANYEI